MHTYKKHEHGGKTQGPGGHVPVDGKVLKDEQDRDYVMFQDSEGGEAFPVYSEDYGWNEVEGSMGEEGQVIRMDVDYPVVTNEAGEYVLDARQYDDEMSARQPEFADGGKTPKPKWIKRLVSKLKEGKEAREEHRALESEMMEEESASKAAARDAKLMEKLESKAYRIAEKEHRGIGHPEFSRTEPGSAGEPSEEAVNEQLVRLIKRRNKIRKILGTGGPSPERSIPGFNTGGRLIKKYDDGGSFDFDFEVPKTKKELRQERRAARKEERQDKKDMIPARFRARGQEGIDAYVQMMRKRKKRDFSLLEKLKGLRSKSSIAPKPGETSGMKCSKYGCSAYN